MGCCFMCLVGVQLRPTEAPSIHPIECPLHVATCLTCQSHFFVICLHEPHATELLSQSYLLALRCSSCSSIVPHSRNLSMWTFWHFQRLQFPIWRSLHYLSLPAF